MSDYDAAHLHQYTTRMRKKVKEAWISALRDGTREQTQGTLAAPLDPDDEDSKVGYCCLGILCEVSIQMGLDLEVSDDEENIFYDGADAVLPDRVTNWAALFDVKQGRRVNDPVLGDHAASSWNDMRGATFLKIADLVEKYVEGL